VRLNDETIAGAVAELYSGAPTERQIDLVPQVVGDVGNLMDV